jgi:polygalacturonase
MERRKFLARSAQAAVGAAMLPELMPELMRASASKAAVVMPATGTGPARLNVRDAMFGATGDGVTKDTAALQAALDRCGVLGGGEVLVPAGNYLTGSIQIRSNTVLRLAEGAVLMGSPEMDDYAVTQVRWEGRWIPGHIGLVYAIDAMGVGVMGAGKIAGNDALGGRPTKDKPLRHPALMEFLRCDGIHLQGFSTSYFHMWSIHPTASRNILIEDLTIRSTGGNGDGIDIDSCKQVVIRRCDISTGDDCISLKSGRGEEAYTQAMGTEDVTISDCTFADAIFACIGIGSENSAGTRRVRVERCKFTGAKSHAIYIKSRPGRGALLEDFTFEDIDASGMQGGFLRINLLNSGLLGEDPVPGLAGIPQGRNFVFRNVRVTDAPVLVHALEIPAEKPLDGLVLENISGTCKKGIEIANAVRVVIKNVTVTGFEGPKVAILNVTGKGLEGAAAATLAGVKTPDAVPEPAEPYKLR